MPSAASAAEATSRSAGSTASAPYSRGATSRRAQHAPEVGQQRGVGVASGEVADAVGHGRRPGCGDRRPIGHAHPAARPRDDEPAPLELGEGARRRSPGSRRGRRASPRTDGQAAPGHERSADGDLHARRDAARSRRRDTHSVPTQMSNCTRTDRTRHPTGAPPQARRRTTATSIDAILDEAPICHLGFVDDGQPFVDPDHPRPRRRRAAAARLRRRAERCAPWPPARPSASPSRCSTASCSPARPSTTR